MPDPLVTVPSAEFKSRSSNIYGIFFFCSLPVWCPCGRWSLVCPCCCSSPRLVADERLGEGKGEGKIQNGSESERESDDKDKDEEEKEEKQEEEDKEDDGG